MPGHIIAVVGGKGGVGKSVFAANMAIAYLQEFKQRPLIIDLDLASLGGPEHHSWSESTEEHCGCLQVTGNSGFEGVDSADG